MSSTELTALQKRIQDELAGIRGTVAAPSGRNISTKGKVFSLPDGTSSQGPLNCVILDHRNFNRYFTEAYNPQAPKPPQCFAIAKEIRDLAPHEEAVSPQAETCAECAMNKFGSAPTGKGKACRNTVRLAVAPADAADDAEPMILTVSPTGLKSWNALVNNLAAIGMLVIQVETEISFDPNAAYPTLLFKPRAAHERLETFWALREKAQVLLEQPPAAD